MSNIYLRQMKELNVDVEQYSKLLDAPIFIVRRLVKGETLSEDMGLNEFIRNNILKKYNELERNKLETLCETNTNIANSNENKKLDTFIEKEEKCENECLNSVLKNLLKDRLTNEEKKLIEIFGGKIC